MSGPGRADLSRLHVVLPVRSATGGKARLGGVLDPEERSTLILGMLLHELAVLGSWRRAEAVHLVTPDASLLALPSDPRVRPIRQRSDGLNGGLVDGRRAAVAAGATAILVLPADLPLLAEEALERLVDAADAALTAGSGRPLVVLAPADAGDGTNALLLSPPDAIEPCFGRASLERHLRAAAAADASIQLVVDPALGFDLDAPEDLERLDPDRLAELEALGSRADQPVASWGQPDGGR